MYFEIINLFLGGFHLKTRMFYVKNIQWILEKFSAPNSITCMVRFKLVGQYVPED